MIIWKNILIEQNRKTTEKENLELKNNIMQLGLINPITLIKVDDNQFKVVAGRRRAMALQELYPNGLEEKHYRIMDKDEKIKNNRLALLNELKNKYIMLTDFSKLNV